jgi:hypothetical protein
MSFQTIGELVKLAIEETIEVTGKNIENWNRNEQRMNDIITIGTLKGAYQNLYDAYMKLKDVPPMSLEHAAIHMAHAFKLNGQWTLKEIPKQSVELAKAVLEEVRKQK